MKTYKRENHEKFKKNLKKEKIKNLQSPFGSSVMQEHRMGQGSLKGKGLWMLLLLVCFLLP